MAGSGSIATKNGDYILVNTVPDVCLTKVGKKWRPIPYNITHTMANSENVSPNVFAGGKPAFMHGESFITGITGDEPGRRGGIVTGTLTEISFALDKSASVYVNGMQSVRTGDCVWMNQQTPAAKQGKVGPDKECSWLKVQGVYKDRWRTPIHNCPIILSINGSCVPFTTLSGGEGYNSAASSEAMAVETKDQPGTVVRQNVEPGSVKVEGVENKELEEATLELKASLRESFGFELKKLINAMFPFQQDWKKYGGSSAYIASAKGNIVGAERWFQDLVNTGDVFDNINFEDVKNGTISILSRAIPAIGISFWLSEGFKSGDFSAWFKSEMEERRDEIKQIASLVKSSAENIAEIADYSVKIYKHEKEIKEFLVHLHEANIDDVELFVENVIGDIDPKLAKDIMTNTDNHSVFLEYFGDSIGREFAAFLARVIEAIPPNFYFFLVGAAGFYILLEVIFGIILGLLFAPAAAGRLALIIARLTQIGKATIAVTKVKGTALAIEAFLNILEFIKNSIDLLKTIGKNLRIIRSPELKKEGQTGETLLLEREISNKVFSSLEELNSLKGTGKNVGDLSSISGSSVEEIISNIPETATVRRLKPVDGKSQMGLEYKWVDENGITNRLRIHDPDPTHPGSNAANGWIARWQKKGGYYDPVSGDFAHRQAHNPDSPNYNPDAANNTHIPIQTPDSDLSDLMKYPKDED
jgi:hypothetical protein